ncbi:hypothetical protein NU219Hw_g4736t1 [Hortaea werneckii]
MRHTEDSDTLTRILYERYTLNQEDVARVWNHVVKLTWGQPLEDRAPHMLHNRHIKGYGGSVKARATYAAIYDKDSPSKGELEKREVNRARITRDAEGAMTTLGIAIQARHASHEDGATNAGTKRKAVEEQRVSTASQQHDTNLLNAENANVSKRRRFDGDEFNKEITAAYKDQSALNASLAGSRLTSQRASSEQNSTTHSAETPIAMVEAVASGLTRSQQNKLNALLEKGTSQRFHFTPLPDRLDMVHAHDLKLSDGNIFFDGQTVIPHDHKIYLLGGKALRVTFGKGDDALQYDVMMCRYDICSYCQHFIQEETGEAPTQEMNTLGEEAYFLQGRPFVHTTDCKNISERPSYSELQFQGTRKDPLEGFPQLRDPNLPKCEVSFKTGRSGWKKVEVELCGQCGHCPKQQYRATSRYGPGFYENYGHVNQ